MLEIVYTSLLVLSFAAFGVFAVYALYKLYNGQS